MNNIKPVLAVETSSDLCSVALLADNNVYYSLDIRQKHIHSEKLIPMIQTVLDYAACGINDLSHIAVSMGPGSFTGLRIGLSAVKGLTFGAGVPICPVPTFDAFANAVVSALPEKQTFTIARIVNIDELYCARYIKENNSYKNLAELDIIKKDVFENYLGEKDLVFGNYKPDSLTGPASEVDALAIARWSVSFGEKLLSRDYDYLEPDYVKKFEGRKSL
jgi:tRNA threonylcarbamoyladenosine biosynthesis protein TsaB